jgi:signal transduction histidine kinase
MEATEVTNAPEPVKGMSLERKIPLMMTAVLLVILTAGVVLSYREVRRAGDLVTTHRIEEVAKQLATLIAASRPRMAERVQPLIVDPTFTRVLTAEVPSRRDLSTVRAALSNLATPADSGMVSELWARDGRVLASVGDKDPHRDRPMSGPVTTGTNAMAIGTFYQSQGRVYYWTTFPVIAADTRIGTIAQRRRLNSQLQTERDIAQLTGQDVRILFRNSDGSLWTTMSGQPVNAPEHPQRIGDINTFEHPDVIPAGRVMMYEAPVPGSPWVVSLELPTSKLGTGSKELLYRFGIGSALLLLVGAIALWLVSRRITSPLASLTAAAERMATGDYDQRVSIKGDYEIARLGSSFNRMTAEVAAAHSELKSAAETSAKAQRAAEEANAAKGNFLAAMSHELRTPLNAIAGYVEILHMGIRGPLNAEQLRDLERIKLSQTYLLGLIEEVLVFAQLDAGQMTFRIEDVQLDAIMRDAQTMVEPQIRARGLDYYYAGCDPTITVHADRDKTQQIVLNLLANGAKYTERGGRVALACERSNGDVKIKVSDTGVGIPAERLKDIFEPFVQADRRLNQPRDGVGLGLTISRDLARAMGGDLMVESSVGVGSTFTLVLPTKQSETTASRS